MTSPLEVHTMSYWTNCQSLHRARLVIQAMTASANLRAVGMHGATERLRALATHTVNMQCRWLPIDGNVMEFKRHG